MKIQVKNVNELVQPMEKVGELTASFYCQSCCQLSMFDDSHLLVESTCLCQEKQKKKKSKKLEAKKITFNYL